MVRHVKLPVLTTLQTTAAGHVYLGVHMLLLHMVYESANIIAIWVGCVLLCRCKLSKDCFDLQVGYVMQPGAAAGASAYGADRGYGSGGRGRGGGGGYSSGGGQRYRPY